MENKITVSEYLENTDMLEYVYTPYVNKVEIVDAMLETILNKEGFATIDSVLLDRVKKQIIIESITNISFDEDDEDTGLSGYDSLCFHDEIDSLLDNAEAKRFEEIIDLRLKDFYNEYASLHGYIHYLTDKFLTFFNERMSRTSEFINNLNAEEIAAKISDVIKTNNK